MMWSQKPMTVGNERGTLGIEGQQPLSPSNGGASTLDSTVALEQHRHVVPTLLKFFGLTKQPFGVTPDPAFLYMSQTHREALASLIYGIETGLGFLALIAEPGMGKTTLLFRLLDTLGNSARTAFLFQTQCTSREFMQFLIAELGLEYPGQDFVRLHEELNHYLLREVRAGKRFVVIIDEAQNLEPAVLETVRLLSNFETPNSKLLQIILAGQPELATKLASRDLVQLRQRLSLLSRLEPFSSQETEQYIMHRLQVSGYSARTLLTPDALKVLVEFAEGIPRKINNFCFNALSLAFALNQKYIDAAIAREVVADLDISRHLIKSNGHHQTEIPLVPSDRIEQSPVPVEIVETAQPKHTEKPPECPSPRLTSSAEQVRNMTLAESAAYLNQVTRSLKRARS